MQRILLTLAAAAMLTVSCAPRQAALPVGTPTDGASDVAEMQARGAALLGAERFTEAARAFDAVLEAEPSNLRALKDRAYSHMRRGDFPRAEVDYSLAMLLDPADVWIKGGRGLARSLAGKHALAVEDFSAMLTARPGNKTALLHRGYARQQVGENALAVEDFSRVVGLDPENLLALYYRARSLFELGRPVQAARDYARMFELDPAGAGQAVLALLGPEPAALDSLVRQALDEKDTGRTVPALDCLARYLLGKETRACVPSLR